MAQAFIASLAGFLLDFGLSAGVYAFIGILTLTVADDNSYTQRTTHAYRHNGQIFEITWDAAGQRAVIRHPTEPEATGYVLTPGTTRHEAPYTGQANFGDMPQHNRHSPGYSTVEDAVNWVCDRLLEHYPTRPAPTPADQDKHPGAIRNFVESLPPSSPEERR